MPYQAPARKYQSQVSAKLQQLFQAEQVIEEWNVARDSGNAYTRDLYAPRLDIAVGPFNIDGNVDLNNQKINRAIELNKDFLEKIYRLSEPRPDMGFESFLRSKNKNPRCFLAIEIENSGSSKHMLGNIANTSIIGLVGIVIPFTDEKMRLCKRLKNYISFATRVEKIEKVFTNILIVSKANFGKVFRG